MLRSLKLLEPVVVAIPHVNDAIMCGRCCDTFRFVKWDETHREWVLLPSNDRDRNCQLEISHCPNCRSPRDKDFKTWSPVRSRSQILEALRLMLEASAADAEGDGPREANWVKEIRARFF